MGKSVGRTATIPISVVHLFRECSRWIGKSSGPDGSGFRATCGVDLPCLPLAQAGNPRRTCAGHNCELLNLACTMYGHLDFGQNERVLGQKTRERENAKTGQRKELDTVSFSTMASLLNNSVL